MSTQTEILGKIKNQVFTKELALLWDWNEKLYASGFKANMVLFYLQLFRNSQTAKNIGNIYKKLDDKGKIALQNLLMKKINNPTTYKMLFEIALRPYIFDPRDVPGNKVEISNPEWNNNRPMYSIKDKNGKLIFSGSNDFPSQGAEGNFAYIYDSSGKLAVIINYYRNAQPNLRLFTYNDFGEETKLEFFKNYLGQKGQFFYHATWIDEKLAEPLLNDSTLSLNGIQIKKLRSFFNTSKNSSNSVKQGEFVKGGIDLDSTNLNMDVRGQASSAISSNVSLGGVHFDVENFQGFTFQIIKFNRNQSPESVLYPSQEEELTSLPY